jgi:hypothetical protein
VGFSAVLTFWRFFFLENSVFWAEAPRKLPQSKDY